MHFRGSAVLAGSLLVVAHAAHAVVPTQKTDALTAMPAARVARALRSQPQVIWSHPASAEWQKLATTGVWHGAYDRATGVPSRIWGSGIDAPGATASPAIAEQFARALLAEHIALLAPGSTPADFVLVSNSYDGNIRSIGFVQEHDGLRVLGGQVSFEFKNDRMFVIGSEAFPGVMIPPTARVAIAPEVRLALATPMLRTQLGLPTAPVTAAGDELIVPLVADDAVLGYRVAVPLLVDGGAEGRYLAYVDPTTGEAIAVRQMNMYASGTVLYHAVDRYPARPRVDLPAPRAHVALNGAPQTTSADGVLTWSDAGAQTVTTAVVGDLVAIVNKNSNGALATTQLPLDAGGQTVWDASSAIEDDAQVQTYLSVNIAKNFVRAMVDPELSMLNDQISANVNIQQDCNAFFDGKSVNFFHASMKCENTGRITDVVFHEFGHAVHTSEIIDGVGAFDGAMSEGAADFLAVSITGDPGMGRGFFYTDDPLRDLDPQGTEARWPEDIGEIHKTGMIFGGTFWDLRKAMIAALGETEGVKQTERLYVGALRRSTSIPTSLIEALATDDDDGNLENGTPHECIIRNAYGRHGLRTASGMVHAASALQQPTLAATVEVELTGLSTRCSVDNLLFAELDWKPSKGTNVPMAGSVHATQVGPASFSGQLVLAPDTTVLYQMKVVFADASVLTLPDNLADPFYQIYNGTTVKLYCTDFETEDPLQHGWTTGTKDGSPSPWSWGVPTAGATDPHAAFSGTHVLAQALDGDYMPKSYSYVAMPPIDIGRWTDVRLQYRRWLGVEDSHFDQAKITVNNTKAWMNFSANQGDSSATQHVDREWRFHDVPLSGIVPGHTYTIGWELTSDEGLEFGGWTLDDVCVVANVNSVCGDGVISPHETCDDGAANADRPNTCRTWCQKPTCGDGIVDDGEECDGQPDCSPQCKQIEVPGVGCCSTERDATAPMMLSVVVFGFVMRRRRRAMLRG